MSADSQCRCSNCGASSSDRELQECSGCHIVFYCDKTCQRNHWKTHKPICKIAQRFPSSTTALELDGETTQDFDSVLAYAAEYLTDLKHVDLWIPQHAVLKDDYNPNWAPTLQLSASVLQDFLQRRKLQSFEIGFDDCCWEAARIMTDSGRAFWPLGDNDVLEKLRITHGVFDDTQDLVDCLSQNLKTLELPWLTLGKEMAPWSAASIWQLISAVSNLSQLVRLRFEDCHFHDSDLESLLWNLPHLKSLALTGCFGVRIGGQFGSYLTDDGFAVIARCCPKLQSLNVSYHRRATVSGVKTILENCKHLRELYVTNVQIDASELETLVSLSSTLLLFGRFCGLGSNKEDLRDAIVASGGRILFLLEFAGLAELSGLPAHVSAKAAESRKLVEEANEKQGDPAIHNEWEHLCGEV